MRLVPMSDNKRLRVHTFIDLAPRGFPAAQKINSAVAESIFAAVRLQESEAVLGTQIERAADRIRARGVLEERIRGFGWVFTEVVVEYVVDHERADDVFREALRD